MPWDSSQADERIDSRVQPSSRTRKELQGSLPLAVKTSSFRRGEDKCTTRAQTCRGNAEARVPGAGQHERSEMMRCRTGTHLIRSMNGSRFCEAALHAASRPGHEEVARYAVTPVLRDAVRRLSRNNEWLWLWVPAFAGTTVEMRRSAAANRADASTLPEAHAEGAPVAAADVNRCGEVLHQHEIAAAHVAPVGLQQERLGVRRHFSHRAVVEEAAVAAIGVVPDRVGSLRQAIVRIVGRKVAAFGPGDAKDDSRVDLLHRVLDRRQDAVGEGDV